MLHYSDLLGVAVQAAASDGSDGGPGKLALVLLLAGFVFYGAMFLRYRNVDKRHHHESATAAKTNSMQGYDTHVESLRGLRNSRMQGANSTSVRGPRNGLAALTAGRPWMKLSEQLLRQESRRDDDWT